jgi:hypothetical protein
MTLRQIFEEIEQGTALAELTLASTLESLLLRILRNSLIKEARQRLMVNPKDSSLFLKQATTLFESPGLPGYAHPGDLALCAYLSILAQAPGRSIQQFVDRVVRENRAEFCTATELANYYKARFPGTTGIPYVSRVSFKGVHVESSSRTHLDIDKSQASDEQTTVSGFSGLGRITWAEQPSPAWV